MECHPLHDYLCHIASPSQFVSHNENDDIPWKILIENMSLEDIRTENTWVAEKLC